MSHPVFWIFCFRSEKRVPAQKDAEGNIFIDRDPDTFAVILTFLRTGILDKELPCSIERLKVEADYFGIKGMSKSIGAGKGADEFKLASAEYEVRAAELWEKVNIRSAEAGLDPRVHMDKVYWSLKRAAEDYMDKAADLRRK